MRHRRKEAYARETFAREQLTFRLLLSQRNSFRPKGETDWPSSLLLNNELPINELPITKLTNQQINQLLINQSTHHHITTSNHPHISHRLRGRTSHEHFLQNLSQLGHNHRRGSPYHIITGNKTWNVNAAVFFQVKAPLDNSIRGNDFF